MKKPRIDLSRQGLKDFFFRHTEKFFFGLAVGLIGLFFWLGLKTPTFDATSPTALLQMSQKAGERMDDQGNWARISDYRKPITDASDRIVNAQPFDSSKLAYQTIVGTGILSLEKRTDPAFLKPGLLTTKYFRSQVALKPAVDLDKGPTRATPLDSLPASSLVFPDNQKSEMFVYRAKGSVGQAIATVDVVVGMALIDYEAQLEAYRETFQYQRGYDANRDVPEFAFAEVQRKTETSDWTPISAQLLDVGERVDGNIKDLIKKEHSIPHVTMDIPPFLGLDYRELVTLPEMETSRAEDYAGKKEEEVKDESEPVNPSDVFGAPDDSAKDDADPKKAKEDDKAKEVAKVVKYRLIRFFDLKNKSPGEKYFYRVRLWFKDPNNPDNFTKDKVVGDSTGPTRASGAGKGGGGGGGLMDDGGGGDSSSNDSLVKVVPKAPLLLDDISSVVRLRLLQPVPDITGIPELIDGVSTKLILRTIVPGEWVESTMPVNATKGFETFVAGPVDAPAPNRVGLIEFYQDETEATIVANSFQNDLSVFVPAETKKAPGSVLNFNAVAHVLHPLFWDIREVFEKTDSRGVKSGRFYETDAVLVDVIGGQRQPFSRRPDSFFAPAEIMIMDRNGRLIIRNDMDDETSYRHAKFASLRNQEMIEAGTDKKSGDKGDKDDDDKPGR